MVLQCSVLIEEVYSFRRSIAFESPRIKKDNFNFRRKPHAIAGVNRYERNHRKIWNWKSAAFKTFARRYRSLNEMLQRKKYHYVCFWSHFFSQSCYGLSFTSCFIIFCQRNWSESFSISGWAMLMATTDGAQKNTWPLCGRLKRSICITAIDCRACYADIA